MKKDVVSEIAYRKAIELLGLEMGLYYSASHLNNLEAEKQRPFFKKYQEMNPTDQLDFSQYHRARRTILDYQDQHPEKFTKIEVSEESNTRSENLKNPTRDDEEIDIYIYNQMKYFQNHFIISSENISTNKFINNVRVSLRQEYDQILKKLKLFNIDYKLDSQGKKERIDALINSFTTVYNNKNREIFESLAYDFLPFFTSEDIEKLYQDYLVTYNMQSIRNFMVDIFAMNKIMKQIVYDKKTIRKRIIDWSKSIMDLKELDYQKKVGYVENISKIVNIRNNCLNRIFAILDDPGFIENYSAHIYKIKNILEIEYASLLDSVINTHKEFLAKKKESLNNLHELKEDSSINQSEAYKLKLDEYIYEMAHTTNMDNYLSVKTHYELALLHIQKIEQIKSNVKKRSADSQVSTMMIDPRKVLLTLETILAFELYSTPKLNYEKLDVSFSDKKIVKIGEGLRVSRISKKVNKARKRMKR